MKKLTYDDVHELLEYRDSELYWKPRPLSMFKSQRDRNGWNSRNAGNRAGGYQAKGYRSLSVHGVTYLCHRVVWLMERGRWPKRHLKFKDGDRSNIDIANLGLHAPPKHPSGPPGVQYEKGRWRARASLHGWTTNLGTHATIEEAVAAREEFKEKASRRSR